jgi:hypothetical protein
MLPSTGRKSGSSNSNDGEEREANLNIDDGLTTQQKIDLHLQRTPIVSSLVGGIQYQEQYKLYTSRTIQQPAILLAFAILQIMFA